MLSVLSRRVLILLLGAAFALPSLAVAQEVVLAGTVTDATGAVLPGVTVTAVHEASGNTFLGVTDGTGRYRIAVRHSPYWRSDAGCVGKGSDGMLVLAARQAGLVRLEFRVGAKRALAAVVGATRAAC